MAERKRKLLSDALAEHAPWMPVKWEPEDAGALQALSRGDAAPHQQTRALKFIIEKVSDAYGMGWYPTGPHEASYAAGRRYTGIEIVKLLKINLSKLRREPSEQP